MFRAAWNELEWFVAWRNMARVQHGILSFVGSLIVGLTLSSCAFTTTVEVKPSDCVNPTASDCSGATNESRILEVRLYQLKQSVDPCKLDIEAFAAGKDLESLKSALVQTQCSDALRWIFKVTAGESRNVGSWEILKETRYVLAVALGRGRSRNTIRLITVDRARAGRKFPTLYFKGYDICLNQPCDANMEVECQQ